MALGIDTYCRSVAHNLLIAHVPSDGRNPPTIVERPLCSVPWQDDFPRGNVPTGKDALRSIHWKLDDRSISMKLYEFAAIDGPEQTSAPEMHQRIIAMATEQGPRIPAPLVPKPARTDFMRKECLARSASWTITRAPIRTGQPAPQCVAPGLALFLDSRFCCGGGQPAVSLRFAKQKCPRKIFCD
jgi:hypothetical protein